MNDLSKNLWWRLQVIALAGGALFGLALAFLPAVTDPVFNALLLNNQTTTDLYGADAARYIAFTYGVLGCVTAGFAVLMLGMTLTGLRRASRETWNVMMIGLLFWYITDTAFSLISGYSGNALLNTGFLIAMGLPLVLLRPHTR
jgi:hypothetical protein